MAAHVVDDLLKNWSVHWMAFQSLISRSDIRLNPATGAGLCTMIDDKLDNYVIPSQPEQMLLVKLAIKPFGASPVK
jgi:hypothetical protein